MREVKAEAPGVSLREATASNSDIFHIDAVSWNRSDRGDKAFVSHLF